MEGVNRTERENSIRSHALRNRQGDTSGKFRRRRPKRQEKRRTGMQLSQSPLSTNPGKATQLKNFVFPTQKNHRKQKLVLTSCVHTAQMGDNSNKLELSFRQFRQPPLVFSVNKRSNRRSALCSNLFEPRNRRRLHVQSPNRSSNHP